MTAGGTYTLLVELPEPATERVGALGPLAFEAGWYAYVGSAMGPGGFARVERHRELAAGEREARHWHVDYLLGETDARIGAVRRSPGVDAECVVARGVDGEAIPGFGCSDCRCESHLFFHAERAALWSSVEAAHRDASDC